MPKRGSGPGRRERPSVPLNGPRGGYRRNRRAEEASTRWMWGGMSVFALLVVGVALWATRTHQPAPPPQLPSTAAIDGISCDTGSTAKYHTYAHLAVVVEGSAMQIPKGTGTYASASGSTCSYWLHTDDTTGVIHIGSPTKTTYTVGNFFAIWGLPLSATDLAGHLTTSTQSIRATVNGKAYTGDPANIPLTENAEIVLQFGPPWTTPPSSYAFPKGE